MNQLIKYNANFFKEKNEMIFNFIRKASYDTSVVPFLGRTREYSNLNLIRNTTDPMNPDPIFKNVRWNIILYTLYYQKTKIFDWLYDTFNCSIQDALQDGGDDYDYDKDLEIEGYRFSSFGIYTLMRKMRGKQGLVHLARRCPTVFTLEDWSSCLNVMII